MDILYTVALKSRAKNPGSVATNHAIIIRQYSAEGFVKFWVYWLFSGQYAVKIGPWGQEIIFLNVFEQTESTPA